jgi:hypothetical protein
MLALYLFTMIALPAALCSFVVFNALERSRRCPTCADETLRLRSRPHRFLSLALRSSELHLRWCLTCGWRGTARIQRAPVPARQAGGRTPTLRDQAAADHVDIRRLDIDGRPWKVMVQCWAEEGRWIGRLLFIGPDGHARMEEQCSIEGGSALEVLSSALSIPDQTLAGRIRRAIH